MMRIGGSPPPIDPSTPLDDHIIIDEFWQDKDFGPQYGAGADDDVTELDEVVVTGEKPEEEDDDWHPGDPIPNPDGGGDPPPGDGGGGGGPPPGQPTDRPYDACEDRAADTLTQDINDEISRRPDSAWNEYGAMIWRDDDGNLHRTRLVPGNNNFVPFPDDPTELGIDSYSRVVGIVHSHPTFWNYGTNESPNWGPAQHGWIPGGDYSAFRDFVSNNNIDTSNFTMYISYGGNVREYDWRENSDPELENSTDDEGFTESGDYNPGATCG